LRPGNYCFNTFTTPGIKWGPGINWGSGINRGFTVFVLGVENEALRGKLGQVHEKWLSESKNKKLSYDEC